MIFESQIKALFDTSPITPILKIHSFPLGMLILGKTLSNFVPPHLKTQQPVLP